MINDKTYYELLNSKDYMVRCVNECLDKMYTLSEPPITLAQLKETFKDIPKEEQEKEPAYEQHYLPAEVYKAILEHYSDVFGFKPTWDDDVVILSNDLFNGGKKDVYRKDINGKSQKEYEDTPKLRDVIGEENAEKVKKMITDIKNFYRFNMKYQTFTFNVMNFSPTSDKETVEEYWRKHGIPEFTINEDKWFKEEDEEENYGDEE